MADKEIGLVEVALEATVLWVRPPRAHVEAGLSHPKPRSACMGVTIPESRGSLVPKTSPLLLGYVKCLCINVIQLNPEFLADTNRWK